MFTVTSLAAQPAQVQTVLIIHWSTEDFPGTSVTDAAIRDTLVNRDRPVDCFTEYLETDRFPSEAAAESLRDYIRHKYSGRRIDAVITVAEPALDFARRYRSELFPDAPIVASVVRVPDVSARTAGAGVTGMTLNPSYVQTLDLALTLHPSAKRVFVIAQAPTVDFSGIVNELAPAAGGRPVTRIDEPGLPQLIEAARGVPNGSLLLYVRFSQEEPGHVVFPGEAARFVAEAARVPVYGITESVIGSGVVGGLLTPRVRMGRRLGEMTRMVLAGTRAQDIPFEPPADAPVFDWRQIRRWGINPALLPADSEIRFRTPTAWDLYHWYIVGAISVVLTQALLIALLLLHRSKRRKAEQSLRVSSDRNRELADSLITAQEEERTRIARELHDDVGQRVASLSIALSGVKRRVHGDGALLRDVAQLQAQAVGLSSDLRQLSHDLHPAALEHLGLLDALRSRCDDLEESSRIRVRLDVADNWVEVPAPVALCFYRVAQEALRNVAQHARAHSVTVRLGRQKNRAWLWVMDDGIGCQNGAAARRPGLGLRSLTERVRMLGGTLELQSAPGAGTTLAVSVPIGGAHAA